MTAILLKDQPCYGLKKGDTIEVFPIGLREIDLCPFSKQMIYRVKKMNQWLPEEDLRIIKK